MSASQSSGFPGFHSGIRPDEDPGLPPAITLETERAKALLAVIIVFPLLSILAVVGRFYGRHITRQEIGADDWVIVGALVAIFGQVATIAIGLFFGGFGSHKAQLRPDSFALFSQLLIGIQAAFAIAIGLSKISICLFLTRIFAVQSFRRRAYLVILYIVLWMIGVILTDFLLCRPFAYRWNHSLQGTCGNLFAGYVSVAITDILGDVLIILLPLKHVWRNPNLTLPKKAELTFLFSLGALEIVVSILRIVTLLQIDFVGDFTFDSAGTYVFSMIEPTLGAHAITTPSVRPVVARILKTRGSSAARRAGEGGENAGGSSRMGPSAGARTPDAAAGANAAAGASGGGGGLKGKLKRAGRALGAQASSAVGGPSHASYDRMDEEAYALNVMKTTPAAAVRAREVDRGVWDPEDEVRVDIERGRGGGRLRESFEEGSRVVSVVSVSSPARRSLASPDSPVLGVQGLHARSESPVGPLSPSVRVRSD